MPKRVVMAPPVPDEPASEHSAGSVPPELLRDLARRLSITAIATLVLTVVFLVYTQAAMAIGPPTVLGWAMFPLLLSLSVAILVIARSGWSPAALIDAGLMYEVLVAACGALLINEFPWPPPSSLPGWSPVAVWVIVFPLVVPAPLVRTLVASFVSAAMDPVAAALFSAAGVVEIPSLSGAIIRFLPNLAAVLLAVAIVRVLHGLQRRASAERVVGQYRLIERLGYGGVGEVWRAEHRLLDRPGAIKLIRPTVLDDEQNSRREVLARFEREVQATANLRSPHTVRIYDFGVTPEGDFYYVMELLDGVDLYTMVERFGPLPPERVVHLLRQSCDSLHEAHQQGLVHRDIKPGNLFACRYGDRLDVMKVLDFGFVKHQHADSGQTQLTQHGVALGTPAFMPPEIAEGRPDVDGRADLYALGCVAWWCLTGATVFQANSSVALMLKHTQETPRPPSALSPNRIPAGLDSIILDCLAKQPARRPETALELSFRLAELDIEKFWTAERKRLWWSTALPEANLAATGEYLIRGATGELLVDRR